MTSGEDCCLGAQELRYLILRDLDGVGIQR